MNSSFFIPAAAACLFLVAGFCLQSKVVSVENKTEAKGSLVLFGDALLLFPYAMGASDLLRFMLAPDPLSDGPAEYWMLAFVAFMLSLLSFMNFMKLRKNHPEFF